MLYRLRRVLRPNRQIDKEVKELKRLKTEVERLNKIVNPAGVNIFEEQVHVTVFLRVQHIDVRRRCANDAPPWIAACRMTNMNIQFTMH